MTATLILEALSKEFAIQVEAVQNVFEMVDAGLSAPFIGRFRRGQTGGLPESQIRRLHNRRLELEELDRRRGTILRALESVDEKELGAIRTTTDRFELEDHFVPHRRPEPEVQLALDRGLGALADLLVKPIPKSERPKPAAGEKDADSADESESPAAEAPEAAPEAAAETPAPEASAEEAAASPEQSAPEVAEAPAEAPAQEPAAEAPAEPEATEAAPAELRPQRR